MIGDWSSCNILVVRAAGGTGIVEMDVGTHGDWGPCNILVARGTGGTASIVEVDVGMLGDWGPCNILVARGSGETGIVEVDNGMLESWGSCNFSVVHIQNRDSCCLPVFEIVRVFNMYLLRMKNEQWPSLAPDLDSLQRLQKQIAALVRTAGFPKALASVLPGIRDM